VVPAAPAPASAPAAPADPGPTAPAPDPAAAPSASDSAALVPTGRLNDQPSEPAATHTSRSVTVRGEDDDQESTLRAAASGAVTIKDFEFAPTTTNIKVGDSVTWNNQGPTTHTATANGGEFDSGNLAKGNSFSHKFTKAGTYSYFCKPHPFMTGKIVVTAAGASSSGSSGSGSSGSGSGSGSSGSGSDTGSSAGASSSDSGSSGSLARTGLDLLPWTLFGFSLLAFGASLRYRLTD
jgi:plastocyanin